MHDQPKNPEAAIKLKEKLDKVKIGMLTTEEGDHTLRSRPMFTAQAESTGVLWFFTSDHSGKVGAIQHDSHVNVGYSDPNSDTYVSVSGRAEIIKDKAKMNDLWATPMKAWFPKGLDTPDIALLKITVDSAEYWDTSSNAMLHLYGVVKAALTGKSARGEGNQGELHVRD